MFHKELINNLRLRLKQKKIEIINRAHAQVCAQLETQPIYSKRVSPQNYCVLSGRSRAVWHKYKLSRIALRSQLAASNTNKVSKRH